MPRSSTPTRRKDVPVTAGFLAEVRDELRSEGRALEHRLGARFDRVDARFAEMEARFDKVDARFAEMEARFDKVDERFAKMEERFDRIDARFETMEAKIKDVYERVDLVLAAVHRMQALMEQQHAENRITLEALTGVTARMARLEARQDRTDEILRELARAVNRPRV